jgi:hypothetical protein
MDVCSRCGRPGHAEGACQTASVAPLATSSMPAPGSLGQSGAFALSGSFAAASNPASRVLRMLKTQLHVAIGQREEDPERAWLELVSIRERLLGVTEGAREDPLLLADVERFRSKLDEAMSKLTRDVGDEVVAPLYSWVDLVRQRSRLQVEVDTARSRVVEARASRGASLAVPPSTVDETAAALSAAERELEVWRSGVPPFPPPEVVAVWVDAGGDALRPRLYSNASVVAARGQAAAAKLQRILGRAPGAVPYVGSKLELVLIPTVGAGALLLSMFALASTSAREPLGILAAACWVAFAGVIGASFVARQRGDLERRAAIDVMWHHTLFVEQSAALDLEVGWLRALSAALRSQRAFEGHKGEGGQLADLARWRPDLEPVVVEVASSSIFPPR